VILSRTAVYALEAVLYLAEAEGEAPARAGDIAEALHVPRNYLAKILHQLAREELLSSTRGPRGGFRLGVEASVLTLERVIDPFDHVAGGSKCLLGREQCADETACAAHAHWKDLSSALRAFFRETTVEDLSRQCTPRSVSHKPPYGDGDRMFPSMSQNGGTE